MKYEHLVGIPFDLDRQNCYQLLRRVYADNFGIELTDYACPTNWWSEGLDLFNQFSADEGFYPITDHPRTWQRGDVLLMAIQAKVGNHVAVLLPDGKLLHHLYGQLSGVTPYGGMYRNNTLGVFRHKLVPPPEPPPLTDIRNILPTHVQRRFAPVPDPGS